MRHDAKLTSRVSEPQHFSLQPWDLESGQTIILVDIAPKSRMFSILCRFDWSANGKIAVIVAHDLLDYLYSDQPLCEYCGDFVESIIFDLRDVYIHNCIG